MGFLPFIAGDGQTFYLDSAFGIGQNTRALKRGYDCPWNSAYLGSGELGCGAEGFLTVAKAPSMLVETAGMWHTRPCQAGAVLLGRSVALGPNCHTLPAK